MTVRGLWRAYDSSQDFLGTYNRLLGTSAEAHARVHEDDGGGCCSFSAGVFWGNSQEAEVGGLGEESSLKPPHGDRVT